MKKRLISMTLALLLVLSILPISALAISVSDIDPLTDYTPSASQLAGSNSFTQTSTLQPNSEGNLQMMPLTTISGTTYNPRAYVSATAVSGNTDVLEVKTSADGQPDIVIGQWAGTSSFTGSGCLQVNVKAKKAGTAAVTVTFYYTYSRANQSPLTNPNAKWFKATVSYQVTVQEPSAPPTPAIPTSYDRLSEISLPVGESGGMEFYLYDEIGSIPLSNLRVVTEDPTVATTTGKLTSSNLQAEATITGLAKGDTTAYLIYDYYTGYTSYTEEFVEKIVIHVVDPYTLSVKAGSSADYTHATTGSGLVFDGDGSPKVTSGSDYISLAETENYFDGSTLRFTVNGTKAGSGTILTTFGYIDTDSGIHLFVDKINVTVTESAPTPPKYNSQWLFKREDAGFNVVCTTNAADNTFKAYNDTAMNYSEPILEDGRYYFELTPFLMEEYTYPDGHVQDKSKTDVPLKLYVKQDADGKWVYDSHVNGTVYCKCSSMPVYVYAQTIGADGEVFTVPEADRIRVGFNYNDARWITIGSIADTAAALSQEKKTTLYAPTDQAFVDVASEVTTDKFTKHGWAVTENFPFAKVVFTALASRNYTGHNGFSNPSGTSGSWWAYHLDGTLKFFALTLDENAPEDASVSGMPDTGYTYYYDGETLTLPTLTCDGYAFAGWSDGTTTYAAGETYTVSATTTLSAQWESATYSITYDFNDKDITNKTKLQPQNPTSYTSDSETITLNPITAKGVGGKLFYEWRDEDGNPVTEIPTGSTGDIKLKAYWKYPVNYHFLDEDGNEISKLTEYFVEDAYADYALAVAEDRNGCTFDGWYQAKKDIGKESKKTTSIYMAKKFELYGQYVADPTARVLTITYDSFGGEGAPEVQTYTFAEGEEYTLLPISSVIPTREGYKFCGWSRIKPQNPWDADLQAGANWFVRWANVEAKGGNVTLYAVWEKLS